MRLVKKEKIRVPKEFRLPGTDIIVEAGDIIEVELAEKKKAKEQDDEEPEVDEEEDEEPEVKATEKKKTKK